MLFLFEIKKYLLAWKRVLCWLVSAAATCTLLYAGVSALLERQSFFEPFTIGIVDAGSSPEVRYVFDFFDGIISLDYLEKDEAEKRLKAGQIPAYVELPEAFAADIMSGRNTPFKLHGSRGLPLQLTLSRLLASGGIAYLSGSQAGIYATLDYAAEHGLSRPFIDTYVLLPINVAFVKRLLEYETVFDVNIIPLTGNTEPAFYFCGAFAVFLSMTGLLSHIKTLRGYTPAIYAQYKLAGQPLFKICCIRLGGIAAINSVLFMALFAAAAGFTGWLSVSDALLRGLALAVCVGAFGLFSASLFRNDAACGLFIFIAALCMLCVSGGVIPLAYLPRALHGFRFFSIPFWVIETGGSLTGIRMLLLFTVVFFGVACFVEFLHTRFSRAV